MRSFKLAALALVLATGAALAHDYRAGDVFIDHPFTRATPPAANVAGGYMTLRNEGDEVDRLLGGETSAAGTVEIHSMEIVDDVARMRPLPEGLEILPGTQVELRQGGYHLMLIGLEAPFAEGERIPLTLHFEKAGTVEVELAVEAPGPGGASHEGHGGH